MTDPRNWLDAIGLGRYAEVLDAHEVDLEVLLQLTNEDLRELDIPLGPRKRLLLAIEAFHAGRDPAEAVRSISDSIARRPASRPIQQAERRQLTVMFCDLVDSTGLSERYDPEDLRKIIGAYQQCCGRIVGRYDGYVASYVGDGIQTYFGYPTAHEDDAERALRASLELIEGVGDLRPISGLELQVRVGVATGLVVVGESTGDDPAEPPTAVGGTPNLAARLQTLAEPNGIVISETTRKLVGGAFDYVALGAQSVKGFSEPVRVWRVVSSHEGGSRFDARGAGDGQMVGRGAELGLLLQRWESAKAGEGQVVFLSGEPGIGKSRIAQALKEQIADQPFAYLRYQCSPYHTNSALYPVICQLEWAAGFAPADTPQEKIKKLEDLLLQGTDLPGDSVPLLADLLSLSIEGSYPALGLSPQRRKQKTLEALTDQVLGLAAKRPLLVLLEDAHWLDPTTRDLLELVIESVQNAAVLMVVSFRPEFNPPRGGYPHVTNLTLIRLTRTQAARLASDVADSHVLPQPVVAHIVAKTDGVPLFVEELTKTVIESGILREENGRYTLAGPLSAVEVPSTLQDSLLARLDRLAPVKEVAQLGSVIGRSFTYEQLLAVTMRPAADLQQALQQLVDAELVFCRGRPPDSVYAFKHALVQEAAYSTLLHDKRQALHARVAKALEEQFPETIAQEPESLALHFTKAGLDDKAVDYWQRAGRNARRRSANTEALEHISRGLNLLQALPESEATARQELELQLARGSALIASKHYAASEVNEAYTRARALCLRLGDETSLFKLVRGLWSFHLVRLELDTALELSEQLLQFARQTRDRGHSMVGYHAAGQTLSHRGELGRARDCFEQGAGLVGEIGDHSGYGNDSGIFCYSYGALTAWCLGFPDQAKQWSQQSLRRAEASRNPFVQAQALGHASYFQPVFRNFEEVEALAESACKLAEEQVFPFWAAVGSVARGWARTAQGDASGIAEINQGLAAYQAMGARAGLTWLLALQAEAHGTAGEISPALEAVTLALDIVLETNERLWEPELYRRRGELILRQHDADIAAAESCFDQALELARAQGSKSWELRAATSLARLWQKQGKREQAVRVLSPIYAGFQQGLGTADLVLAKVVLESLR